MKYKVGDKVRANGQIGEIVEINEFGYTLDCSDNFLRWYELVYESEIEGLATDSVKCECGAEKTNTLHSTWCPKEAV